MGKPPHVGAGSSPACCTSNPTPANRIQDRQEGPSAWEPTPTPGIQKLHWTGPALFTAIWEVNHWMKDLSLSLPNSDSYIIFKNTYI